MKLEHYLRKEKLANITTLIVHEDVWENGQWRNYVDKYPNRNTQLKTATNTVCVIDLDKYFGTLFDYTLFIMYQELFEVMQDGIYGRNCKYIIIIKVSGNIDFSKITMWSYPILEELKSDTIIKIGPGKEEGTIEPILVRYIPSDMKETMNVEKLKWYLAEEKLADITTLIVHDDIYMDDRWRQYIPWNISNNLDDAINTKEPICVIDLAESAEKVTNLSEKIQYIKRTERTFKMMKAATRLYKRKYIIITKCIARDVHDMHGMDKAISLSYLSPNQSFILGTSCIYLSSTLIRISLNQNLEEIDVSILKRRDIMD